MRQLDEMVAEISRIVALKRRVRATPSAPEPQEPDSSSWFHNARHVRQDAVSPRPRRFSLPYRSAELVYHNLSRVRLRGLTGLEAAVKTTPSRSIIVK